MSSSTVVWITCILSALAGGIVYFGNASQHDECTSDDDPMRYTTWLYAYLITIPTLLCLARLGEHLGNDQASWGLVPYFLGYLFVIAWGGYGIYVAHACSVTGILLAVGITMTLVYLLTIWLACCGGRCIPSTGPLH